MGRPRSSPVLNSGFCLACGAELVQRENEPRYNFIKRTTCNKKCGAIIRQRRAHTPITPPEQQFACKHYTPDTPGFAELAALYTKQ